LKIQKTRRIGLVILMLAGIGCSSTGGGVAVTEEIDPSIYSRHDDPNDPFRAKYAEFRARRVRSTYVEHSHVIPEFYYAMSGPVIYSVDGEPHRSVPGDILFNNSYSPHLIQGIVDGLVFYTFSSTFAPNGDRSVFDRPYYLVEPLPQQPASAQLADDVDFHLARGAHLARGTHFARGAHLAREAD